MSLARTVSHGHLWLQGRLGKRVFSFILYTGAAQGERSANHCWVSLWTVSATDGQTKMCPEEHNEDAKGCEYHVILGMVEGIEDIWTETETD